MFEGESRRLMKCNERLVELRLEFVKLIISIKVASQRIRD